MRYDDQPKDGIRFFERALLLGGAAVAVLTVWAVTAAIFSLEPRMPRAEPQLPFESRQQLSRLTHPIGCDVTMSRPGRRPACSWKEWQ